MAYWVFSIKIEVCLINLRKFEIEMVMENILCITLPSPGHSRQFKEKRTAEEQESKLKICGNW